MNDYIKILQELINMAGDKQTSGRRFAAVLITAIIIALIFQLPALLPFFIK